MKSTFLKILSAFSLLGTLWILSCEPVDSPNIPPTANLDFQVISAGFQPLEDARIYLFPFKSLYDAYVLENPQGKGSLQPTLDNRNKGLTDASGSFVFSNYSLQGTAYASGASWVHRPNPLFFRVEATLISGTDTLYLTNDGQKNSLSFGELDNGILLTEEIEVIVE